MNFLPRPLYEVDVQMMINKDNQVIIEVECNVVKYYEISDILKYNNEFFQVLAKDYDKNILITRDVTDKVKVS